MSNLSRSFLVAVASFATVFSWGQAPTAGSAANQPGTPAASSTDNAELRQRIEDNIRAHFKIPASVKIEVGAIQPGEMPGYDGVKVTLVNGDRRTPYDFYISRDGKTLAQLNKLDVSQNPFDVSGRPSRGPADAKVTLLVYDDFQCPYCARAYKTLFSEIYPEYKDKVRIVYKDFPLYEIHPWAIHAAVDANCLFAQSNDAYWDFADYVHLNQGEIKGDSRSIEQQYAALDQSAATYGGKHNLDKAKLQACLKAQDNKDVMASVKYGESTLGLDATPTMFLNGSRMDGAIPADALRPELDAALRDAGLTPPAHPANASDAKIVNDATAVKNVLKAVAPPAPGQQKPSSTDAPPKQ